MHDPDRVLIFDTTLRDGEQAPRRASVDPMDFPQLLPQVFMLGRKAPGDYVFRLAGGFVTELHGLDLRGVDVTADETPYQAGLGFCVRTDKTYVGSDALDPDPGRRLADRTRAV